MYFIVDNNKKVILGWSPKCGCSHIKKIFWYLQTNDDNHQIHTMADCSALPDNVKDYIIILIIRNPFKRVISGFLDKYAPTGECIGMWKRDKLIFSEFIDELVINNWDVIDKHHFIQQTDGRFNKDIILQSKELKIYDLKKIDYNYLEKLYNKKIPEKLLNFKGHEKFKSTLDFETDVYNLDMCIYNNYNIPIKNFYNEDIRNKILNFYKNDFFFFKELGFEYEAI